MANVTGDGKKFELMEEGVAAETDVEVVDGTGKAHHRHGRFCDVVAFLCGHGDTRVPPQSYLFCGPACNSILTELP